MNNADPIVLVEKKVNVLLAEKKLSANKLCQNIGMTAAGYSKMWKKRSIKVETIQKIANYLDVPINHFFDSKDSDPSYAISTETNEVNEMREKYIQALESENKLLKELLNKDKSD